MSYYKRGGENDSSTSESDSRLAQFLIAFHNRAYQTRTDQIASSAWTVTDAPQAVPARSPVAVRHILTEGLTAWTVQAVDNFPCALNGQHENHACPFSVHA